MSLSKPSEILFDLVATYMSNLFTNPVRTKAITSCVVATFGNYIAQRIMGVYEINQDSLIAFGLFGLLFGGPIPHFFYKYIHLFVKHPLGVLVVERLLYTPCFQALSLYMLSRFEGKSHQQSYVNLQKLYGPLLLKNLQYLTLLQFINIRYVPPMLRVLVVNMIGLLWTIYMAKVRAKNDETKRRS